MTINAERLVRFLKTPLEDREFQSVLSDLRLPPSPDRALHETELVAVDFGVTLQFTSPHWMQDPNAPRDAPVPLALSDLFFTSNGYQGGPPYSGALPEGLTFSDTRESVYARLGQPVGKAMFGIPNEQWAFGDRYMTIDFRPGYQSIKKVTTGVLWNLVKR